MTKKNWGLLGFVIFISACMKQPTFDQDFGPEVSSQAISEALNSVETVSPYTITQGEFSYLERTTQVEGLQPLVTVQTGTTVIRKCQDPQNYVFTLGVDLVELIDGEMKPSHTESEARLQKNLMQATSVYRSSLTQKAAVRMNPAPEEPTPAPTPRTTFHNLRKESVFYRNPILVQMRPNCGGIAADLCRRPLPATQISFDRVEWEGETGNKVSFLFVMSPSVPYFSSQLLGCASTTVPYEGQRVKVTQCEEVKDFTFGQTETAPVPACVP